MNSLDGFVGTYNEHLIDLAAKKRVPISGTFELLPNCNMRCRMCYIQHTPKGEELQPVSFWVRAFEQTIEQGMLYPLITGGEPLVYPWFHELYERVMHMPVHLVVNTNGTLLDRETVKWMAKLPPRRLNISLYGTSNETYASLCGNPKGFTQVTQAFDLLREFNIDFRVHTPLVPENIQDYEQFKEVCNHYRAPLSMVNYMFPAYRKDTGCTTAEGRFSAKEMAEVRFRYFRDIHCGDEKSYRKDVWLLTEGIMRPEICSTHNTDKVQCLGGVSTFSVDWRGNACGCGVHNQHAYSLHEMAFSEAWKRIVEDTDRIRFPEKCKTCKYRCICNVCPAACFCETGCMNCEPEYLCQFCEEYAKLLFEERRRLFDGA